MDNQLYIFDVTNGIVPLTKKDIAIKKQLTELLNNGYEVKRCYTTNNVFIFHIAEVEEEEEVPEQVVESVIEVSLSDDPSVVKAYTDDGWVVRDYYSKRVQLIKHRQPEEASNDE